jgi:NTP pyrophosphatase (non-canonical NTP hydrolase)
MPYKRATPAGAAKDTSEAIDRELKYARRKFPGNRFLLAALVEEVGELASAMLQRQDPERIRAEAVQVACVAVRIIEEGDCTFDGMTEEEAKP